MRFSLITSALLALAASPALATMYITSPVAATSRDGGDTLRIRWHNEGSPALSRWGGINLWLATGDSSNQFKLDTIATNLSTSRRSQRYRIPDNIGPSGQYYFIRAESTDLAANGSASYQAFSAKFTLSQVSGTFNSTVLAAAQEKAVVPSGTSSAAATSSSSSRTSSTNSAAGMSTSTSAASAASNTALAAAAASGNSTSGAEALLVSQPFVLGALGAVAAGVAVML